MEYLVTMTTQVPDGTPENTIREIRAREATRSRQLAEQGHLLRLWRPPLRPGEWRTLGLFDAADDARLDKVLASMPLRVWRTDEVQPLAPHPHDPPHMGYGGDAQAAPCVEFLITLTVRIPAGTAEEVVEEAYAREAAHSCALGAEGHLLRLWRVPLRSAERRALGLWRARDASEMQAILEGLPMIDWMDTETTPLVAHPNDPRQVPMSGGE
jgi:muconolactone delta-isomerase